MLWCPELEIEWWKINMALICYYGDPYQKWQGKRTMEEIAKSVKMEVK